MERLHPEGIGAFLSRHRRAYWHSALLALLFLLAMLVTVLTMNAAVGVLLGFFLPHSSLLLHAATPWVIAVVVFLLLTGTGLEWYRLHEGGPAIARRLGARHIQTSATVYEERQLLRVIEQLSLVSGLPAPVPYVLDDEPAINAFVAGYQANDMVLVVTWGALQTLDIDELRGVVGHEFSHIHHGDTALNLRLMSVLSGLLLISQMGRWLLQFAQPYRRPRAAWCWSVFGRLVWVLGSLGVFMGRFIKLAILRQREFMADEGSLQFTRTDAVLRALLRIRAHDSGSMLYGMHAESISHLCFGSALMSDGWFSTHPALDERIGRLNPNALQRVQARDRVARQTRTPTPVGPYPAPLAKQDQTREWQPPQPLPVLRVWQGALDRPDGLPPLAMAERQSMCQEQPDAISRALSTGAGCRELLAAIMVSRRGLDLNDLPADVAVSRALVQALHGMDARVHVLLFHAALGGLGDLPESAARQLLSRLALMIQSDGQVALGDLLLLEWLKATVFLLPESLPIAFADCHYDVQVLVDAMLQLQQLPPAAQAVVRTQVLQTLFQVIDQPAPMLTGSVDFGALLTRLAGLPHLHRVSVLAVTETCLWANVSMTQEEHDMLQLLHWRLGLCPEVLKGLPALARPDQALMASLK